MDLNEKERIVQKNIIEIFKENFNVILSDEEILDIWPEKVFDCNYIAYYESILDIFLIEPEHMGDITGKVKDSIKKVAILWEMTPHVFSPWELEPE